MAQAEVQVVCPEGCGEGMMLNVTTPDGQVVQVQIPAGVGPGMPFNIFYAPLEGAPVPDGVQLALDVQPHDDDVKGHALLNPDEWEAPPSSGAAIVGETGDGVYHQMKAAAYYVGQQCQVLRSDESWSPAVIVEVNLTAMGPVYTVDIGGGVQKTGVEEGHISVS
eukprot:TRINITY_DN14984_c0_g1_i1.p1 TRINITY_DN14984_c0_g1~~TRINITY_DN14984_c0_g1_i1.p1  ORF type:complete len:165 (+),score=55.79 TRINITY_DN14984_c0_g1_i1:82-576(+)